MDCCLGVLYAGEVQNATDRQYKKKENKCLQTGRIPPENMFGALFQREKGAKIRF